MYLCFFLILAKCYNAAVTPDLDSDQCCATSKFTVPYSEVG